MSTYIKRQIQNFSIFLLVLTGFANLLSALPFKFTRQVEHIYGNIINPSYVMVHGVLSFMLGLLMLLLAYSLFQRIRNAWIIEVIFLSATLALQIVRFHKFSIPIVIIELFVLLVLVLSYKDFCRLPNKVTLKWAFVFIGISFVLLFANASIGLYMMRGHINDVHSVFSALAGSIKLLIFMDASVLEIKSNYGRNNFV